MGRLVDIVDFIFAFLSFLGKIYIKFDTMESLEYRRIIRDIICFF